MTNQVPTPAHMAFIDALTEARAYIEDVVLCDWRRRGFRYHHDDYGCAKCRMLAKIDAAILEGK